LNKLLQHSLHSERWLIRVFIIFGIASLSAYASSKFTSGRLVVIVTAAGILGFIAALTVLAFRLKNLKKTIKALFLSLVAIIAGTYVLLFGFVFFFQDAVANRTNSFFQPRTITVEAAEAFNAPDVQLLDLETPDGIHLRGWLARNTDTAQDPLLIYFGGSGSEASEVIPYAQKLKGWSVALINYRGFGLSEGTPTHANALADALFIYDSLSRRADIDSNRVVAMGYSLGTGIAVYLSDQRPTVGTILVSPYDYWTLIGLKQTPLYAPLTGIMKPYFDSISRAPGIRTPLLCLVGSEDDFVPPERSLELVNAWGGKTEVISFPGEDHSLLFHDNSSWMDIQDFLKVVKP
jgi:pimeloyl-ACP methyl ester carboxylesterase